MLNLGKSETSRFKKKKNLLMASHVEPGTILYGERMLTRSLLKSLEVLQGSHANINPVMHEL